MRLRGCRPPRGPTETSSLASESGSCFPRTPGPGSLSCCSGLNRVSVACSEALCGQGPAAAVCPRFPVFPSLPAGLPPSRRAFPCRPPAPLPPLRGHHRALSEAAQAFPADPAHRRSPVPSAHGPATQGGPGPLHLCPVRTGARDGDRVACRAEVHVIAAEGDGSCIIEKMPTKQRIKRL